MMTGQEKTTWKMLPFSKNKRNEGCSVEGDRGSYDP